MKPAIIVHGGAGAWDLSSGRLQEGVEACRQAAAAGQKILTAGGSALDAVEAAVHILEDSPVLDAGRGSYVTTAGIVEMDALLMDGQTLALGCVAAVTHVRHPISLARRVMTDTPHAVLVGGGANQFADQIGFPRCPNEELIVDDERIWPEGMAPFSGPIGDTVGAVALDQWGNIAVGTSTGGTRGKMPGRVGDSPLVGSGGYADNLTGGVSATGHGESLMKLVLSKQACDLMGQGFSAQLACQSAIHLLQERLGEKGQGGLIGLDKTGRVGFFFNTAAMPYAFVVGEDEITTGR